MPDKIGVAFVGCTHPHIFARLQLLSAESDVALVGCYDPDEHLVAALHDQYGLRPYASPQELLDQPGVRLVVVEGWDPANPVYVREAVKRQQAVLLEKPGAPNLAEMRALVGDVRGQLVPFQVGYMLRFSPAIARARDILQAGVLGPITLARCHAATPVGGSREVWQSLPGDQGGLVYTDGCHMAELIVHLFGMPQRVKGTVLKLPAGPTVLAHGFKQDTLSGLGKTVEMPLGGLLYEDVGAAVLEYDDKLVTFDITAWEAQPWVEAWQIEIYGADGTLYVGLVPPWYKLYVRNAKLGYSVGWHSWSGLGASSVGNSLMVDDNYTAEVQHMLRRVRTWDTDNAAWLAEAEGVIAILDAIYRSSQQNDSVVL